MHRMGSLKQNLYLLILFGVLTFCESLKCPPCNEKGFTFETDFEQKDCPANTFYEENAVCDCFPSCVAKKGYGKTCKIDSSQTKYQCAPGLKCVTVDDEKLCELDKESCLHYNFITDQHFLHEPLWKPECLQNGDYAPKQCKGEVPTGRCFCYDVDGQRLFGQQWWRKADNMTCACSRKRAELLRSGRTDVTIHCDPEGNYEKLQCDSEMCWCADQYTGSLTSIMVPEQLIDKLPCFDTYKIGDQYLRQCESQAIAQARIQMELTQHGTTNVVLADINCDSDGSYGNYQSEKGVIYCSWRDKSRIGSWQIEAGVLNVNCNCARDFRLYELESLQITFDCEVTGNYKPTQKVGERIFCVDSDGFAVSKLLLAGEKAECVDYIYQKKIED